MDEREKKDLSEAIESGIKNGFWWPFICLILGMMTGIFILILLGVL